MSYKCVCVCVCIYIVWCSVVVWYMGTIIWKNQHPSNVNKWAWFYTDHRWHDVYGELRSLMAQTNTTHTHTCSPNAYWIFGGARFVWCGVVKKCRMFAINPDWYLCLRSMASISRSLMSAVASSCCVCVCVWVMCGMCAAVSDKTQKQWTWSWPELSLDIQKSLQTSVMEDVWVTFWDDETEVCEVLLPDWRVNWANCTVAVTASMRNGCTVHTHKAKTVSGIPTEYCGSYGNWLLVWPSQTTSNSSSSDHDGDNMPYNSVTIESVRLHGTDSTTR